jgi:hypothetical protein
MAKIVVNIEYSWSEFKLDGFGTPNNFHNVR